MRHFRLLGALHPAAIGDGFVIPIFGPEDEDGDATFIQKTDRETINGFLEIHLGDDDVILNTNSARQLTVGDRPLIGFKSRVRGLLIGNAHYLREALLLARNDYPRTSSIRRHVEYFLERGWYWTTENPETRGSSPAAAAAAWSEAVPVESGPRENRATFIVEPLDKGYGLTLGNALRRVLLSSVPGAAITSIRIPGMNHEFAEIKGVRETVAEIVDAVRRIDLRITGAEPVRMSLSMTGPADVTAGDIALPDGVEIMNVDLAICQLEPGAEISIELHASEGKGYVPAANNRPAGSALGLIPVDAVFSPVRQVTYKVEQASEVADADRLVLSIETDGTISPRDAVGSAARTLRDRLALFMPDGDPLRPDAQVSRRSDAWNHDQIGLNPYLAKPVAELELSSRTARLLKGTDVVVVADLLGRTKGEMLELLGMKSVNEITEILSSMGLAIGVPVAHERSAMSRPLEHTGAQRS